MSVDRTAPEPTPEVTLAKIEGIQVKTVEDGKRVRVLFTPEAREAADKATVTPYVERVAASDTLRFALNGTEQETERPFGRPTAAGTAGAQ